MFADINGEAGFGFRGEVVLEDGDIFDEPSDKSLIKFRNISFLIYVGRIEVAAKTVPVFHQALYSAVAGLYSGFGSSFGQGPCRGGNSRRAFVFCLPVLHG